MSGVVRLNVGGTMFATTLATLKSEWGRGGKSTAEDRSFLQLLAAHIERGAEDSSGHRSHLPVARDDSGAVFIDREGRFFRPILHLLRTGRWVPELASEAVRRDGPLDPVFARELREECAFYGVVPPEEVNVSDASLALLVAEKQSRDIEQAGVGLVMLCERVAKAFVQCAKKGEPLSISLYPGPELIMEAVREKKDRWILDVGPSYDAAVKQIDQSLPHVLKGLDPFWRGALTSKEHSALDVDILLRALCDRYGITAKSSDAGSSGPHESPPRFMLVRSYNPSQDSHNYGCTIRWPGTQQFRQSGYAEYELDLTVYRLQWSPTESS